MKDSVIILSGGMDSVTLLHDYRERIAVAVTFDYHARQAEREIECARWQCEHLGIRHVVLEIPFMEQYFRSALFASGGEAVPDGSYSDENQRSTVVPFRNGIMLAVATGLAESEGLSHVLIANHAGDHAIYPDCRAEFVDAMSAAMQAGTYDGVSLLSPYTHLDKRQIALRGRELGVDFAHTYSCYNGGAEHCGTCATCIERREALAGFDPTAYAVAK